MKTAKFYHAGCPVCVEAEQKLAHACTSRIDNQFLAPHKLTDKCS